MLRATRHAKRHLPRLTHAARLHRTAITAATAGSAAALALIAAGHATIGKLHQAGCYVVAEVANVAKQVAITLLLLGVEWGFLVIALQISLVLQVLEHVRLCRCPWVACGRCLVSFAAATAACSTQQAADKRSCVVADEIQ